MLIVLSAEAEDLALAQLLPTLATTSNQWLVPLVSVPLVHNVDTPLPTRL